MTITVQRLDVTSSFLYFDFQNSMAGSQWLPTKKINGRTEINDIEKRKHKIVIRGIKESEDVEEKVEMIMEELRFKKGYHMVGRIGGLRKREGEKVSN